jgi:ATP-dependent Clp protease protease subunit
MFLEDHEYLGVYYDSEKRKILLVGDLNDRNTKEIVWALQEMESIEKRDPINMYINSNGGNVDSFLAIYDTMQDLECDVNTIGIGKVYSAGAYLLLSGTGKRCAYTNALIMLHELSDANCGKVTDMRIYQNFNDRVQEKLNLIVASHTGQSPEKVAADMKRDLWLMAEEAKDYGIIDEII